MIIKWIQPNVEEHPCDARVFSLDTASILCATVSRFFIFRCLYFYTPPAMCLYGDEKPHVLLKSSLTLSSSRPPPKKRLNFLGHSSFFYGDRRTGRKETLYPRDRLSAFCVMLVRFCLPSREKPREEIRSLYFRNTCSFLG